MSIIFRSKGSIRQKLNAALAFTFACLVIVTSGKGQVPVQKEVVIDFEGNKVFSNRKLLDEFQMCRDRETESADRDALDAINYCLRKLKSFLSDKGYFRANVSEPKKVETDETTRLVITIQEGQLYRLGEVQVLGSHLFSASDLLQMLSLKHGEIVTGEALNDWLERKVKDAYANRGYIQFAYGVEPSFRSSQDDTGVGTVDFQIDIHEGQRFRIRSIKFEGAGDVPENALIGAMLIEVGDVFRKQPFEDSLKRLGNIDEFKAIDADKDVDYKWDQKNPLVDLTIHLKRNKN